MTGVPVSVTQFGMRLPRAQAERLTDEAIAALVGMKGKVEWAGVEMGEGTITHAARVDDEMLGPGVWVTVAIEAEGHHG